MPLSYTLDWCAVIHTVGMKYFTVKVAGKPYSGYELLLKLHKPY